MKLGSMFGSGTRMPLARAPKKTEPKQENTRVLATKLAEKKKPGEFDIKWPETPAQTVKDYRAVLTLKELEEYLKKCQETGYASFDWETAPSEETRAFYEPRLENLQKRIEVIEYQLNEIETKNLEEYEGEVKEHLQTELKEKQKEYSQLESEFLYTPLDPWKGEICTVSISALPHESRVVPISHKAGKNIASELSRNEAREAVLNLLDRYIFTHKETLKIAVNLSFETKYAAKYGRYILGRVADPLLMWVRCKQLVTPGQIKDGKKPTTGWGLKPATKVTFGVTMQDFKTLLGTKGVSFFDEIDASSKEGLVYSAEDSDYGLQHYLYWVAVAKQIPDYYSWFHDIEMPFQRVVGLMEYWGMKWDAEKAKTRYEEALEAQEHASEEIKRIAKETFGLDINPGKSGKTGDVKELLFQHLKLPAAKYGKTGASLDEESLLDMKFMLENNLENLDEEAYLSVSLPEGWENINLDAVYGEPDFQGDLSKDERGAIRVAQRTPHPYKEQGLHLMEQLRKIQKYTTLISSHIVGREKYLNEVSGRIHAGYSTFTDTARCNSFRPNGQNVPRTDNDELKIRSFFIPAPGKILFFIDFSGFELRLMAWKSGDETMIEIFNTGGDMHRKTAATLTEKPESEVTKKERTDAKPGNFGIAYGGTEHALQKTYKKYGVRKSLDECLKVVNAVKKTYPGVPHYQREAVIEAREKGYAQTIYGYKRLLRDINGPDRYKRQSDERRAGNTPIQGSAADIIKKCQNAVYEKIGEDTYNQKEGKVGILQHGHTDMIAQIHDEIIFEMDDDPKVVKAAGEWVKSLMEQPPLPNFPVPIEAEASVGYSWSDKMSVEKWLEEKGGQEC